MSDETKPKPFHSHGSREDHPQQTHELAAGLAHEIGVSLCDPSSGINDPEEAEGLLRVLRMFHDEAVRHGALCDGYDHDGE
jgi:hypothetical protein